MIKILLRILIISFLTLAITVPVLPALAQLTDQQLGLQYGSATGLTATDPRLTAVNIIRILLGLLGVVMVVIVIYAGFLWMTAGGNDEQIGMAKKWISASVIGLALILSAYTIATFVVNSLVTATQYGGNGFQLHL